MPAPVGHRFGCGERNDRHQPGVSAEDRRLRSAHRSAAVRPSAARRSGEGGLAALQHHCGRPERTVRHGLRVRDGRLALRGGRVQSEGPPELANHSPSVFAHSAAVRLSAARCPVPVDGRRVRAVAVAAAKGVRGRSADVLPSDVQLRGVHGQYGGAAQRDGVDDGRRQCGGQRGVRADWRPGESRPVVHFRSGSTWRPVLQSDPCGRRRLLGHGQAVWDIGVRRWTGCDCAGQSNAGLPQRHEGGS